MQPDELVEKPMSPMHYARSGLGTAELNGKLIAAGKNKGEWFLIGNLAAKPEWAYYTCLWQANLGERRV